MNGSALSTPEPAKTATYPRTRRSWQILGSASALVALGAAALSSSAHALTPEAGPTSGGTVVSDEVGLHFTQINADMGAAVLASDQNVYAWGANVNGGVGDGTTQERTTPVQAKAPDGVRFLSVTSTAGTTLALGDDGNIYGWGLNHLGQLGNGTKTSMSTATTTPTTVIAPAGVRFVAVDLGGSTAVALGDDGQVYAWGYNSDRQAGALSGSTVLTPTKVTLPDGVTITQVSSGGSTSAALSTDGRVFTWGNILGSDRANGVQVNIPGGVTVTQIEAGNSGSGAGVLMALTSDGKLYGWGENSSGVVDPDTSIDFPVPVLAQTPPDVTFSQIALGKNYAQAVALSTSGEVYAWGHNNYGQLGDGTTTNSTTPVRVHLPAGVTATQVAAGADTSAALSTDGHMYIWGGQRIMSGSGYYFGDGVTAASALTPVKVADDVTVSRVAFGDADGTDLSAVAGAWTATTPAHPSGPVDVTVEFQQFSTTHTQVTVDGFVYGTAPAITEQPQSATVTEGDPFTVVAAASGDEAPTATWESSTDGVTWTPIDGATSSVSGAVTTSSLTLDSVTVSQNGLQIRATFTNPLGEVVSQVATLTVTAQPVTPTGTVRTRFVDEAGTDLRTPIVHEGSVGEIIAVDPAPVIDGYELISEPSERSVTLTEETQEYRYVYRIVGSEKPIVKPTPEPTPTNVPTPKNTGTPTHSGNTDAPVLAWTGSDLFVPVAAGALLLISGALLVLFRARRRNAES